MTVPVGMLLGFAAWTMLLLLLTVGIYRCSRIVSGRASIAGFPADRIEGEDWYRRSMRAHANCIENLPVFGAIVFALYVSGVDGHAPDYLAIGGLIARVIQSLIHVCLEQTDTVVMLRFTFFSVQFVSYATLIAIAACHQRAIA